MTARRNHGMTNPAKSLTNPPIPPGTPTSRRPPPGTPTSRRHPWERRRLVGIWGRRRLVGIPGNADVSSASWERRRLVGMANGNTTKKPERRLAVASFTGRRDVGAPRGVGAPSPPLYCFPAANSLMMAFSRKAEVRPNCSELSDPSKLTVFTSREVQRKARTRAN